MTSWCIPFNTLLGRSWRMAGVGRPLPANSGWPRQQTLLEFNLSSWSFLECSQFRRGREVVVVLVLVEEEGGGGCCWPQRPRSSAASEIAARRSPPCFFRKSNTYKQALLCMCASLFEVVVVVELLVFGRELHIKCSIELTVKVVWAETAKN